MLLKPPARPRKGANCSSVGNSFQTRSTVSHNAANCRPVDTKARPKVRVTNKGAGSNSPTNSPISRPLVLNKGSEVVKLPKKRTTTRRSVATQTDATKVAFFKSHTMGTQSSRVLPEVEKLVTPQALPFDFIDELHQLSQLRL
ncbi:uncharacterized protein CANTADRAFT_21866 [Suhomyces tanzawaensis NRRL Y-17324]|uniref:Uncharacterized protein n=1 Tax=Suhomyces tanzawaensis NRRL Y-17324 TaxID=984487 RepID=A0A1E4SI24_9ASCO|nr:uncharacterized protein CANTADRAFT_21866 [Suhomyces tanzawaensis NRRL Y-17324]ODV79097.1 hypothetical protein CANTADRAFT_21866 [Suhomyces tanzawaensis NRRL Y-17324]